MSNVPMTRPEDALAIHTDDCFRRPTFAGLADGRIVMTDGRLFYVTDDGGVTWSEGTEQRDSDGNPVLGSSMTNLGGNALGLVGAWSDPAAQRFSWESKRTAHMLFWRSEDGGETWAPPVHIQPPGVVMHAYQDVLLRTSSGRIILPLYSSMGQGTWHHEGAPFVGGYWNGNYISTDAHFYDPHFSASYVVYSDDEGQTWNTNRDGELIIHTEYGANPEYANEPSVTEVSPGRLLMIMRTGLGRMFQAWSDDDGTSWSRPEPTQLAGTNAPGQVRKLPGTGHLLVVWTQQSEREIKQGFIRTRLSSAVSRNGGGIWEFFQNVESIHEETRVEAGPIQRVRPQGRFSIHPGGGHEVDAEYSVELENYGRWSYPSVYVAEDRVLIAHSDSPQDPVTGDAISSGKLKVLPISWFYGGRDPAAESFVIKKIEDLPPRP